MCLVTSTRCAHFVAGSAKATWFVSWNAPRPSWPSAAEPPSTSNGIELSVATYIGVTVLVIAGPEPTTTTPALSLR